MKRFRVIRFEFDARVHSLTIDIQDHWEEAVKELHKQNREKAEQGLIVEFGEYRAEQKRQNFIDLGPKPFSIVAFHNRFLEQIRVAFVMDAYYPALTGACTLGERILNYLILTLRGDFRNTPEYKRVYNKDSFDDWDLAINTLEAWDVLLPEVVNEFRSLRDRRNDAIHFRVEVIETIEISRWLRSEVSVPLLVLNLALSVVSRGLSPAYPVRYTLKKPGRADRLYERYTSPIAKP